MSQFGWFIIASIPVVLVAWFIRKMRPVILQIFVGVIASIAISFLLSLFPEIISPSPHGEGGVAWTIILAATTSLYAVPVFLITITAINYYNKWRKNPNKSPS